MTNTNTTRRLGTYNVGFAQINFKMCAFSMSPVSFSGQSPLTH